MLQEITNVPEYSTQLGDSGVKLYFYRDVYDPLVEQETHLGQELSRLRQPDKIGNGTSVIVILINFLDGFATDDWEVVNSLPRREFENI